MKIEMRPIADITPYERNPRHNDAAVDAVAASIREFGFRQPIVVDADGVIIVGHTRLKAALSLGMAKVPVHVAKDLTPDQAKALRLADNKVGELATWDMEMLGLELADLRGADFDLEVLGFDMTEVEAMLADPGTAGLAPADEAPEPGDEKDAVSRPGDLWVLGRHRLLCGDSTSAADVDRLMDGEKAALVSTDPPYLVDYTGERPNDTGKDWTADYREIDIPDADAFFHGLFANIVRVIAPHAAIYCWHAHKRCGAIQKIWADLGILDHQSIVWVKPTPVFGRVFWHFRHEPCMMGWVKGSMPTHDGDHSMEKNSVWELGWEDGQGGTKSRVTGNEHPTQKPVEIFARPMRKHTKPGQVCYEPFSGSGSQIIAGEQEGRRVFAMEISPVFVDVAVRRWEKFTGETAQRFDAEGVEQAGIGVGETAGSRA
jgi:DNA modification methylase